MHIVDDHYLLMRGQLYAWAHTHTLCIIGTVNGCGYNDQHKCITCATCRPCHLVLSTPEPVFRRIRQILLLLQLAQMPRSPDLANFCVHDDDNNDTTDYFIPCTCMQGKKDKTCTPMALSIQIAKFKFRPYQLSAVLPTTIYTVCIHLRVTNNYMYHRCWWLSALWEQSCWQCNVWLTCDHVLPPLDVTYC